MHALLITFSSTVPPEAIADDMTAYADALGGSNGLVSKAWLHDGDTLGGFYVFRDAEAASAYLASDLVAGMQTVPLFSGFQVRRFDLLDDLGAKTGVPAMAANGPPLPSGRRRRAGPSTSAVRAEGRGRGGAA